MQSYKDFDMNIKRADESRWSGISIEVDGKVIKQKDVYGSRRGMTTMLLDNIRKRYGVRTLCFFVSNDHHQWKHKLQDCDQYDMKEANKEYRKHKCVTFKNKLGYDEFYCVKGGAQLSAQEDEFEVGEDASTAKIRTAFKKFASSKKNNKTLLSNFGKAVA